MQRERWWSELMPQSHRNIGEVYVWDLFVRAFHWSLAAAFFVAYFTEDEAMALHVWSGYAVGGLVSLRIVWGLVGTRHARFSDFLFGPLAASRYLRDLASFRADRYLGHSPAGGFMVYLLMAGCLVAVLSGLLAFGAEGQGPLKNYVHFDNAPRFVATIGVARADADEDERGERKGGDRNAASELYEELHEVVADILMVLIVVHIVGVLLASLVHRENLVRSMVTGRKRRL